MSAIPAPFTIEFSCPVTNVAYAERRVHLLLDDKRISQSKEFFRVSAQDAANLCEVIAAFESEDDSVCEKFSLHHDLLAASYRPHGTLRNRKLIYAMMAATVNNTQFDRLLLQRRGPVDGFLTLAQVSRFLSVGKRAAADALKSLVKVGGDVACHPIDLPPITNVFDFIQYRNGHMAWKFSDAIRTKFYNPKL
jgi:Meiotically up-regulated gene 113